MNAWSELTDDEYAAIWDRFYADFNFQPDYRERSKPAILELRPFVTFDLSVNLNDETLAVIDNLFLDSFRVITPIGRLMYSLDWHHTCYRFDPQTVDGTGPIGWYPNGDY